jgi:Tol biopolymer transport system component
VELALPKGTLNLGPGPLSPDGKTIAREGFDEKHPGTAGIYITRASDGKIVRRVTRTHYIPGDFSPTGKQLVLFRGADGEPPPPGSLWVVSSVSTGLRRLTPRRMAVECCTNYRWSPDGGKILFADASGVIWTIAPDGSNLKRVFKDRKGRYAATPTWSPDGSRIVFALDPTPNPFDHPPNGLYVIDKNGTGLRLVIGGGDFKREPVWVSG